jgi:ketosteroid isomerase-like protein
VGVAPDEFYDLIINPFQGQDIVAVVSQPGLLEAIGPAFTPYVADGFVTEMVADSSFRQERTGMQGFIEAWRDWAAPFDRLLIEVTETREFGDRLLTVVDQVGLPKGGENEIRAKAAAVWQFAAGRMVRVEFHLDPEIAEKAARRGLEAAD